MKIACVCRLYVKSPTTENFLHMHTHTRRERAYLPVHSRLHCNYITKTSNFRSSGIICSNTSRTLVCVCCVLYARSELCTYFESDSFSRYDKASCSTKHLHPHTHTHTWFLLLKTYSKMSETISRELFKRFEHYIVQMPFPKHAK